MIQSGGPIELGDDCRQLDPEPPLVAASSNGLECLTPVVPPGRHKTGDRFDDQHAVAFLRTGEQPLQEKVASVGGELVDREGG